MADVVDDELGSSMRESIAFRGRTKFAIVFWVLALVMTAWSLWATLRGRVGWMLVACSALVTVLIIFPLLRLRSLYLRLDEDGFEITSRFEDKVRVLWTEVEEIKLQKSEQPLEHRRGDEEIKIVYWRPPRDEIFIEDEYRSSMAEIVQTLNEWRAKHGRR